MELTKINGENHIYLYGPVVSEKWYEDEIVITSSDVRKFLDEAGGDVIVHLNTGGGDAFEGVAIYNTLMNHREQGHRVDIVIDSWAASAGTIIAMAGTTVKGRANTTFMIHHAWSLAIGNTKELRKQADDLEKIDISICQTYKERFKGDEKQLNTLLDDETFMTAQEAVEYGFYDEIIQNKTEDKNTTETVVPEQKEEPKVSMQAKSLLELFRENHNGGK